MEKVDDISIQEAVINVLDSSLNEPIINEFKNKLSEETYDYLYKHIKKAINNKDIKYCKYIHVNGAMKKTADDFFYRHSSIITTARDLSLQLFNLMKQNNQIPPCDLIVASIITNQGPFLSILKMDYLKGYTHKVQNYDDKIGINLINQNSRLPASNQKVGKAAFIRANRDDNFDMLILDKHRKSSNEYDINYFTKSFCNCRRYLTPLDNTKGFMRELIIL